MKATEKIALKICQYNGQKGTKKQIEKCVKSFKGNFDLMIQFCGYGKRIDISEIIEELYSKYI